MFLIIFIALTGAFAFYVGGFFERGQADLAPFFQYHPWLYLLLVPAVAMRLWAEERKSGTIELLMTLPISPWEAILGKFFAAWGFIGVALLLTLPMWITVNVLGDPDNGVIFAGYVGSFLMAGAFLAIGSCISAVTRNQVIAFIVAPSICFLLVMSGLELVLNVLRAWTPGFVVSAVSSLSFLSHFDRIAKGVLDLPAHRLLRVADRLRPVRQPHLRRAEEGRLREERRAKHSRMGSASFRPAVDWLSHGWRGCRATRSPGPASALASILLLSVNLFAASALRNAKVDLTQQRLFTISDGTRAMLRAIDEPISLRLYYSKRLGEAASAYGRYFERVRAVLQQYRDISGGQDRARHLRSRSRSRTPRTSAVAAGLRGVRLNQEGEVGYFGLVGSNSTDTDATIPFFTTDRETFLEYDLTKLIYTLANPKKRVVGLMTGLPLERRHESDGHDGRGRQQQPPQMIMEQIRDFFEVKTLAQDVKEIPADVDVLMVAQPDKLTPEAAYAIDQYVLGGGKILALVDPVPEMGARAWDRWDDGGRARRARNSSSC